MEFLTLLAAIVATALESLAVQVSVETALGLTVDYSVNAKFKAAYWAVVEAVQIGGTQVVESLQRSLRRSYLLALQSIIQDCQQELLGLSTQQPRSSIVTLPPDRAVELRWLDDKLAQLVAELQALKRSTWQPVPFSSDAIDVLSRGDDLCTTPLVCQRLIDETLQETTIPNYREKVSARETGLFARLCSTFAAQLDREAQLQFFGEQFLLPALNASLLGQALTLSMLVTALQQMMAESSSLRQHLESDFEEVWQDSTMIRQTLDRLLIQQTVQLVGSQQPRPLFPGSQPNLTNPFLPLSGRIELPHHFFDRKAELSYLFELLNQGKNVVVTGDREIGKSSLLWLLQRQSPQKLQDSRRVIDLNLVIQTGETVELSFYQRLCEQLGWPTLDEEALDLALQSHRLLLLLDQVETATQTCFTHAVQTQLRRWADGVDAPLRLVLATRTPLEQLFPDQVPIERASPLAGICQEVPLFGWDEATCHAFIHQRLQPTPIRFTSLEVAQIIERSRSNPRRLMNFCHCLYARYLGVVEK